MPPDKRQVAALNAADLHARLTWRHGPERTADILAGRDERTRVDLARWRLLGLRA